MGKDDEITKEPQGQPSNLPPQANSSENAQHPKFKAVIKTGTKKEGVAASEAKVAGLADLQKFKKEEEKIHTRWKKVIGEFGKTPETALLLQSLGQQMQRSEISLAAHKGKIISVGDENKRIFKLVQAHFETISKKTIDEIEHLYPHTLRRLFNTALRVTEGDCGEKIEHKFVLHTQESSSWKTVFPLLLLEACRNSAKGLPYPEIFNKLVNNHPQWNRVMAGLQSLSIPEIEHLLLEDTGNLNPQTAKWKHQIEDLGKHVDCDPKTLKAISWTFERYISHLSHPSSHLVLLFLNMKFYHRALATAANMKNPAEKTKSLLLALDVFLEKKDITRALECWGLLTSKGEWIKASRKIEKMVEILIENSQVDQIMSLANMAHDDAERDIALKEVSQCLIKYRFYDQGLKAANLIRDEDIRDQTLSNLVHVLAGQKQFKKAKELLPSIHDAGFREDGVMYIVKAYLALRYVDEAVHFIEAMPIKQEKAKPARLIESALKAFHMDEKVRKLRQTLLFQMPQRFVA